MAAKYRRRPRLSDMPGSKIWVRPRPHELVRNARIMDRAIEQHRLKHPRPIKPPSAVEVRALKLKTQLTDVKKIEQRIDRWSSWTRVPLIGGIAKRIVKDLLVQLSAAKDALPHGQRLQD